MQRESLERIFLSIAPGAVHRNLGLIVFLDADVNATHPCDGIAYHDGHLLKRMDAKAQARKPLSVVVYGAHANNRLRDFRFHRFLDRFLQDYFLEFFLR